MAEVCLRDSGDRWLHVHGVARAATQLREGGLMVSEAVVSAAWLHDVGYGAVLKDTGFHPLDGARWLRSQEVPEGIVSMVAYHSGAEFEAEERGLSAAMGEFEHPDQSQLDTLTLVDMTVGPAGQRMSVKRRIEEILSRYPVDDPVHHAVIRSRAQLRESAERAAQRLGLADVGTRAPV